MNKITTIIITLGLLCAPALSQGLGPKDNIDKQVEELTKEVLAEGPRFSLAGELGRSGNNYTVNGESFAVNSETKVFGVLQVGSVVEVRGLIENGKKIASHLVVNIKKPQLGKLADAPPADADAGPVKSDGIETLKELAPISEELSIN